MPRPNVLRVAIHSGYFPKLERLARNAELSPVEYVYNLVVMAVNGFTPGANAATSPTLATSKAVVKLDDIPVDIERGATPGSYAGVTKRNGAWEAKAGRTVLGRFSTPEVAALARYFAIVGYKAGRGAYYETDIGLPPEMAAKTIAGNVARFAPLTADQVAAVAVIRGGTTTAVATPEGADQAALMTFLRDAAEHETAVSTSPRPRGQPRKVDAVTGAPSARRAKARGGAAPPSPAGDSRVDDALQGVDPPAGPETAGGSRETSADGGRTPSTSIRDATEGGADGQADLCPICDGEMNPGIARKHPRYCLLCSDDYETWLGLPDDQDGADDVAIAYTSTNVKLAPQERAFMAYLMRARGLL